MSKFSDLKAAIAAYVEGAGVTIYDPASNQFGDVDPEFIARMVSCMLVSHFKYGAVRDAYPHKFTALADIRTRVAKYRETGNRNYLVDAANFAMIESMFPAQEGVVWGPNDASDSPGRNQGRRLVQEANDGTRVMGETILHHPGDL